MPVLNPDDYPYSWTATTDSLALTGYLFIPTTPAAAPGLVTVLHGAGGDGTRMFTWGTDGAITDALEARGWYGFSPDGRPWEAPSDPSIDGEENSWAWSYHYAQDVLDGIAAIINAKEIAARKLFLFGFSMGGAGALRIGLQNSRLFSAIASLAPETDSAIIYSTDVNTQPYFVALHGGTPDAVPEAYRDNSARFLLGRAAGMRLYFGHGDDDTTANNNTGLGYAHSRHITDTATWTDSNGHTRTLGEMASARPGTFTYTTSFLPGVGHAVQDSWIAGAFAQYDLAARAMFETEIRTLLIEDEGIQAIADDRVGFGMAAASSPLPYVAMTRIGTRRDYTHDALATAYITIQFDSFGATLSAVDALSFRIREILEGRNQIIGSYHVQSSFLTDERDLPELPPGSSTATYRRSMDFEFAVQELAHE